MTTALVTGATRGIGREVARRLVEAGHTSTSGPGIQGAGRRSPPRSVRRRCGSTPRTSTPSPPPLSASWTRWGRSTCS